MKTNAAFLLAVLLSLTAGHAVDAGQLTRPPAESRSPGGTDPAADLARKSAQVDKLLAPWDKRNSPGAAVIVIKNSGQFDIAGLPMAITRIYLSNEMDVPEKIVNIEGRK